MSPVRRARLSAVLFAGLLLAALDSLAAADAPPPAPGLGLSHPDDLVLQVLPLPASSKTTFEDFRPRVGIMADPDWHTWCPSVIRGDDGRYHLFHSRWPRSTTFNGWLVHSELAHAVADHPAGPFAHVETTLGNRGAFAWNATTAHNPKIKRFAGRFCLYFCSTHGETNEARLLELSRTGARDPLWMPIRNNQRTGVAVADSLEGPWRVSEQPIVEPSGPITRLTVNPAICQGPDGTYFMIVKGDSPTARRRNQALATSRNPDGPFTVQPQPVIEDLDTEDCSMWYDAQRRRFYAVFHAHTFIGMMTSADGYQWSKAAQYQLTTRRVRFDDGSYWEAERMERPFVLTDTRGQPQWLYVAVKKGDRSYDLALPLHAEVAKPPIKPAGGGDSAATRELKPPSSAVKVPRSAIERGLEWRGVALAEPEFTLWDVSPIRDADGKVHLFVGRWPEKNVDPAWRKSSEVAHYVGDQPEGPFRFRDVVLRGTGTNTWDRFAPHNPEVRQFGDTYALTYIANDDFRQPPHPRNQRIGLAVSKSLDGPWRKVGRDGLVLESSPDTNHWTHGSQVVNPSLVQVGGKFHLYFKSRCQGQPGTVYGVAIADQLEGPYHITGEPLTTKGVMIEDGFAFAWQGKVCLISTDNHGGVTGIRGGGALWVSDDGLKFNPAWTQVAYDRIPAYFRGYDPQRVEKIYGGDPKLERPKLLLENGQPAWLFAPSGWNVTGGERTVLHVLRIELQPGDSPLPATNPP